MKQKKEDEIMAEYLLKGGKMLEKTCRQCGCPQFEYKGKTFCVVCAEREQEKKGAASPAAGPKDKAARKASAAADADGVKYLPPEGSDVSAGLSAAILDLCRRIREEEDPDRCLVLMDAVKTGTEALSVLHQF